MEKLLPWWMAPLFVGLFVGCGFVVWDLNSVSAFYDMFCCLAGWGCCLVVLAGWVMFFGWLGAFAAACLWWWGCLVGFFVFC
ncbi:hypothetical protein JOD55_000113 [Arcanobacterium pluranimalium]|uniref:hypothetical protein n=1 Tax=Arcanobacterium pluranimalium TaxID=108028 RepID=UPI00195734BE|nr:hypothetical protein [Arcanobacterium pluranimalium]MBM7824286.1 hypothetical protein [Arcanobacterium pluranimalium]